MPTYVVTGPDGKEYEVDGPEGSTPEQALQQVQSHVQQQGSGMQHLQTYMQMLNPAGFAAQKAAEYGGQMLDKAAYNVGGRVTDALAGSSDEFGNKLPPEVAGAAGYGANLATQIIPTVFGGEAAKAASPAIQATARSLMRSALKPGAASGVRGEAAVGTMLNEGANVSAGGVEKLKGTLGRLGGEVEKDIAGSGAMVPTRAVADYVPQAYPRFENGPAARSAVEDLGKVQENFLQHPKVAGATEIPVQVAHDLKRGYQRAIGDRGYGELKTPTTEGEKQIARGLRELEGEAVPSIVEKLKREREIINALKYAERRVAVEGNKNPIGLGALLSQPWMAPIWMWDRSSLAKSITARALNQGSQRIPQTLAQLMAAAASGYNNTPALDPYTGGSLYR